MVHTSSAVLVAAVAFHAAAPCLAVPIVLPYGGPPIPVPTDLPGLTQPVSLIENRGPEARQLAALAQDNHCAGAPLL
jgi:hypothetical protein